MNQQIVFRDAVFSDGHDFRMCTVHTNAFVAFFAEHHRFAVLEVEHTVRANGSFGEVVEGVIVEDVAVLIDRRWLRQESPAGLVMV